MSASGTTAASSAAGAGAPAGMAEAAANGSPFHAATPPPPAASEPIQGLSLVGSVIWSRVKKNPAPVAALVVGFLLALGLLRNRS